MSDSDISLLSESSTDPNEAGCGEFDVGNVLGTKNYGTRSQWSEIDPDEIQRIASHITQCVDTSETRFTQARDESLWNVGERKVDSEMRDFLQEFVGGNENQFVSGKFRQATMEELLKAREYLDNEASSHSKRLKKFVKDNFESCIRSKDTISEVARRMHAAEAEDGLGAHGATPGKVEQELGHVSSSADSIFSELIARHNHSENLERVLLLLGKYDSLVLLPSMVRKAVDARDFEQVVILYQQAMKLVNVEAQELNEVRTIWKRLNTEVCRAMSSAVHVLQTIMNSSATPMAEAFHAAHFLDRLNALQVPATENIQSFDEFINFQVESMIELLNQTRRQMSHSNILHGATDNKAIQSTETFYSFPIDDEACREGTTPEIACIATLSSDVFDWTSAFWELPWSNIENRQSYFQTAMKEGIMRVFSTFSALVKAIIDSFCLNAETKTLLKSIEAFEILINCCLDMEEQLSAFLIEPFRDLVFHLSKNLVMALEKSIKNDVKNLFQLKGSMPENLEPAQGNSQFLFLINKAYEYLWKLSGQASHAGIRDLSAFYPPSNLLRAVSEASADAVEKIASRKPPLSADGYEVDEVILLLSWNAMEKIKTQALPKLVKGWHMLLSSGISAEKNADTFKWCCNRIESSQEFLIKTWVETKLEKLDPIMRTFLDLGSILTPTSVNSPTSIKWSHPMLSGHCRPVIWELISAMMEYDADMYSLVEVLRDEVMGEIYLAVLEGVQNLTDDASFEEASLESKCQLLLDFAVLTSWLEEKTGKNDLAADSGGLPLAKKLLNFLENHIREKIDTMTSSKKESLAMYAFVSKIVNSAAKIQCSNMTSNSVPN